MFRTRWLTILEWHPQSPSGINAFATLSPPRSSGVESVLVSANWKSLTGSWNLRGIATVMSMARFLRGQTHWAKDFVFAVGDDYIEGIDAFLRAYHGIQGDGGCLFGCGLVSGISLTVVVDLQVEPILLEPHGVIWAALNIDYPGHSFSHLGLYYGELFHVCMWFTLC